MKGAIVGYGKIAVGHLLGYQQCPGLTVSSVVDICSERRRFATENHGLAAYSSFEELIKSEELDFIDICTPPDTHEYYSIKSLDSGYHTLCEKPVFLPGPSGYEAQVRKLRSTDKLFYPCHNYKYSPIIGEVKRLIQRGVLGEILRADFKTLRLGHALGVEHWMKDWRRDPNISRGGILRDHGPHSIYTTMHLTNSTPISVSCIAGQFGDKYTGTEDTAFVSMRCTNGVEATFTLSWAANHRSTCYSISGSRGSITVEDDNLIVAADGKVTKKVITSEFDDPSHKNWFRDMFIDFKELIKKPELRSSLIEESLTTSLAIDAAYDSTQQSGSWVDLNTAMRGAA